MLRLTLLLIGGLFMALYTLGEDRGQLRPGLALAESEGRLDEVWAEARAKAERVSAPAPARQPVLDLAETAPPLLPEPIAPTPMITAEIAPVVEVEPDREVVAALEDPVFSLGSFGNEPVPSEVDITATEDEVIALAPAEPEVPATGDGTIWYVTADSVNVRAEPSTDAEVLGRLVNGEAALLVTAVDDEWARIVIQGDGMEGYVALRYLSSEAP